MYVGWFWRGVVRLFVFNDRLSRAGPSVAGQGGHDSTGGFSTNVLEQSEEQTCATSPCMGLVGSTLGEL